MGDAQLGAFVLASLVVLIIPGPAVLYVVARSLSQGRSAGLASVLGLSAGGLVHVLAATLGLSAILVTSATAFTLVKLAGALYLIYLGLRALLGSDPVGVDQPLQVRSFWQLFRDGVAVNALNPKIAVFFLAFLPQFVSPEAGSAPLQIMALGLLYLALGLVTDWAYAVGASWVRDGARSAVIEGPWPRRISGGLYIGLGVTAALSGRKN